MIRSQPQPCFQLLGLQHVVLQHFGYRRTFQGNDALVDLVTGFRVNGDDELALAQQRCNISWNEVVIPFSGGAQMIFAAAFHHGQCHRPAALHLHDQRTFKLERGGEQTGSGHHLAQKITNRLGISVIFKDGTPSGIKTYHFASDFGMLE